MQLKLVRRWLTPISTTGEMYVDDVRLCYTLELPITNGLPGGAIPEGTYKVTTYASPHFGRLIPLIEGIPGRSEIEIHFGNRPKDTRGCILVGYGHTDGQDYITESREAFYDLWFKAQGPMERGECFITIVGQQSNHDAIQNAVTGEN
jgi:hypothetical protein